MATLGTGAKKETTEWDDILRAKGVIPEMTVDELARETVEAMVEEKVANYDPNAGKTVDELDAELDEDPDSDEERILQSYRDRRVAEMRENAARKRYGPDVARITAVEWKDEITKHQGNVVVHLTSAGIKDAALMTRWIAELAAKFVHTKFVECRATDAIKNYPDSKVPTLLVYRDGAVLKQFVTLAAFDGQKTVAGDIEWALKRMDVVPSDMAEPPQKKFSMKRI